MALRVTGLSYMVGRTYSGLLGPGLLLLSLGREFSMTALE